MARRAIPEPVHADAIHQSHSDILRRFEKQSSMVRGKLVRVDENGGFEGVTEGLDPRGFLQVRSNDGLRIVYSGTVRLITSH